MKKGSIFGSIKGFFGESPEEIKEDIKEAEELIKEKTAKLKDAKKKKGFFSKIFDESEDEIKEEIKEAEELIKEKKKQLSTVSDKNPKKADKKEVKKVETKTEKEETPKVEVKEDKQGKKSGFSWIIIALVIIGIILIIIGFAQNANVSEEPEQFKYLCEEKDKNPCTDRAYSVNCIQLEEINQNEGNLHFEVENREKDEKDCRVKINLIQDDEILESKTYGLGAIAGLQTVKTKIKVTLPDGNSTYDIEPSCE